MRTIRGKVGWYLLALLAALEMLIAVSMPASALEASFTASPAQGTAPLTVTFTPKVIGTPPFYFNWTFGDGTHSTEEAPTHTFANAGDYLVDMEVTCSCQPVHYTVHSQQMIKVESTLMPLSCSFSASKSNGTAPLSVTFNSTAVGGVPPYSYLWTFGDGSSSTEVNTTHVFSGPGTYTVLLTVRSSDATTPSTSIQNISVRQPLKVLVSAEAEIGTAPLKVNFSSTVEGGTTQYTYLWDFGDGNTSSDADPSHTYLLPGSYIAKLDVTDSTSDHASDNLTIQVVSPQKGSADNTLLFVGFGLPLLIGVVGIGIWAMKRRPGA